MRPGFCSYQTHYKSELCWEIFSGRRNTGVKSYVLKP
jgi:hypothetical protein